MFVYKERPGWGDQLIGLAGKNPGGGEVADKQRGTAGNGQEAMRMWSFPLSSSRSRQIRECVVFTVPARCRT
jgi:hypothetical protein